MPSPALPTVVVSRDLPSGWLSSLEGRCELRVGPAERTGFGPELRAAFPTTTGILCTLTERIDPEILDAAPRLQVISNMAVGVDNVDVPACTRRGIPVGHTPGVLTDATADLALALLLAIARGIDTASRDARAGRWTHWSPTGWLGRELRGATLGIWGLGKIGLATAQRARGFGVDTIYASRTRKPKAEAELGLRQVSPKELLQRSDIVSLHVPLTAQTRHLVDTTALRTMRRDAFLVNTARGGIVDTDALVRALGEGWIAGAALDVTDPEPLPPTHALYAAPNCLITPHIGSATHDTRKKMAELACANLLAGLAGERLPHCVNSEVYRLSSRPT